MIAYVTRLEQIMLSLHVLGALMWIGGLFAFMAFLEATINEPDKAARERLMKYTRQAAIVPDVGLTIALVFGAHMLFKYKLYQVHFMHGKLALVAILIGLTVHLRMKFKKLKAGETVSPPPLALKPMTTLLALGILIFVITKLPT
jgi:uncharacterized membrane protein